MELTYCSAFVITALVLMAGIIGFIFFGEYVIDLFERVRRWSIFQWQFARSTAKWGTLVATACVVGLIIGNTKFIDCGKQDSVARLFNIPEPIQICDCSK